jgi:hypothetical protein
MFDFSYDSPDSDRINGFCMISCEKCTNSCECDFSLLKYMYHYHSDLCEIRKYVLPLQPSKSDSERSRSMIRFELVPMQCPAS